MKCRNSWVIVALSVLLTAILANCEKSENTRQLTFPKLLQELLDRDRLAIYPDGKWTQHQASSYDRESDKLSRPKS